MRKVLWLLFSVILIALLYYLFIKPFEFEVNLRAKTLPGDLIATIRIWNRSLDSANIIEVDSFSRLKQAIVWEKRSYIYNWHFVTVNDSVTKVSIQISEPNRSLLNKLLIPFTYQPIERDASDIATKFHGILKEHLNITGVEVKGEVELDSKFCACTVLKTNQIEKANGMMKDYPVLTSFIETHKLKADGPPIIRVRKWNHGLGLLEFDFCFPIVKGDSLPVVDLITYKEFTKEKVLKAEYHGNYITSDRAWYELLQYVERNGYKTAGMPIEYFHDNPNLGANEENWKADVYLPIMD